MRNSSAGLSTGPTNSDSRWQQNREVIPHSNLDRQETPCKLGRSTSWYFKLQWMSCSRSLHGMSNSSRNRWMLAEQTFHLLNRQWLVFELTLYNILSQQHYVDHTTTRNSDQDKAWPPNTPGAQEAQGHIQQLTPTPENNTRGLGEQMQNSKEVSQTCPRTHVSPTSKYKFPETISRRWSLKVSLLYNFTPRMSRLGIAQIETPDKV